MDALLLTDYMRLELVRMPVPEPGPEDAVSVPFPITRHVRLSFCLLQVEFVLAR